MRTPFVEKRWMKDASKHCPSFTACGAPASAGSCSLSRCPRGSSIVVANRGA